MPTLAAGSSNSSSASGSDRPGRHSPRWVSPCPGVEHSLECYELDSCLRTSNGRFSHFFLENPALNALPRQTGHRRYQKESWLRTSTRRFNHFSFGFTLLELIVVIAIIAIATAGVSFALRDTGQAALDREGDRLAALLESGRAQSRASGVAVRWRPVDGGFAFEGLPKEALPTHWLGADVSALPMTAEGVRLPAITLGPDPIIAAQQVLLRLEGPNPRVLRIATDGLRPFAVSSGLTSGAVQ